MADKSCQAAVPSCSAAAGELNSPLWNNEWCTCTDALHFLQVDTLSPTRGTCAATCPINS